MNPALLRSALTAALLALLGGPVFACSCMRGPDAPLPPHIVEARVVSVQTVGNSVRARLEVLRNERGKVGRRISVVTPPHSAACGVTFQQGEVRRLGFSRQQGRYSANLCQQIAIDQRRP